MECENKNNFKDTDLDDKNVDEVLATSKGLADDAEDKSPWYALKLFGKHLKDVEKYFNDIPLTTFVPRHYVDYEDRPGHIKTVLRPVVSNLIFVKKSITDKYLKNVVRLAPYPMFVLRKQNEHRDYYEIPAAEMLQFRMMCDPNLAKSMYLTSEEAALKVGDPVIVKFGPLKGLSGRLVRQSKKYYLLKEVPGMGVMLKVSRWCCRPIEETKS